MPLLFLSLLLAPLLVAGELNAPLPPDRGVYQITYPSESALRVLLGERAPWALDRENHELLLDLNRAEMEDLQRRGYHLVLDEALTFQLQQPLARLENQSIGIPGFPCYLTVEETYAAAEQWLVEYPNLTQWVDIGDSWEKTLDPESGFDLRVLVLGNREKAGPKPTMFVMSSVHAREYAPAGINARFAQMLLQLYGTDPQITWLLDHHEIHLMLQANPDGRVHAETGLFWRKNTNDTFCTGSNNRGVDLNRNFAFEWGCCNGSSGSECSEVYRGPSPGSEPEIMAIQDYVRSIFPDQRVDDINEPAPDNTTGIFVDIHSSGGYVFWPYGFTSTTVPNEAGLRPLGRKLAYFTGYTPMPIIQFTTADGSTVDFAYGELGVAALAYEVGNTFFQSCSSFDAQVSPDNLASLVYLARHARTPYLSAPGPDVPTLSATPEGTGLTVSATIDDTRYNNSNGGEPVQSIVSAALYVDVPPWEAGAEAIPLQPVDGTFDRPVEAVTATLDTAALAEGRHILFVHGTDGDGFTGAVEAAFFQVALSYEGLLARWPEATTILDLLIALP